MCLDRTRFEDFHAMPVGFVFFDLLCRLDVEMTIDCLCVVHNVFHEYFKESIWNHDFFCRDYLVSSFQMFLMASSKRVQ